MKMLKFSRLIRMALVLGLLFGVTNFARSAPPVKITAQVHLPITQQAPTLARYDDCGCSLGRVCNCGPLCDCFACRRATTKKADDGGPNWQWDWHRGQWWRPVSSGTQLQSMSVVSVPLSGFGGFNGGGGGC